MLLFNQQKDDARLIPSTMYWRLMKPNFMPKTEEGALYFYVGAEGSDRTKILINNNVEGEPNTDWNWPS